MKTYTGHRLKDDQLLVVVKDQRVFPRFDELRHIQYHSTGFEWGYEGSGPADLALSILADYLSETPEQVIAYAKHGTFWGPRCEECGGEGWILNVDVDPRLEDWKGRGDPATMCTFCEGLGFIRPAESLAVKWHQMFKREFVAGFEKAGWKLTGTEIAAFIEKMKLREAQDVQS
jgi:hypothetical protein